MLVVRSELGLFLSRLLRSLGLRGLATLIGIVILSPGVSLAIEYPSEKIEVLFVKKSQSHF